MATLKTKKHIIMDQFYVPVLDGIPGIMPGVGSLVPPYVPVEIPNPIPPKHRGVKK